MKNSKLALFMLCLLASSKSFAIGEGVAAGGGGGDQIASISLESSDQALVSCPGFSEVMCSSQECLEAAKEGDAFNRDILLKNICDDLKSK